MANKIVIVGAGLAGLACANRLHQQRIEFVLLEGSDEVGGRVRTDEQDGFLLDRGFQVFLSAYPKAGTLLDLEALDLHRFKPGALVFQGGKLRRLMDVFRSPQHALSTALQPIGTLKDKLLVGKLRLSAMRKSYGAPGVEKDRTTEEYLRRFGFSETMIDSFFRAFYGGIFLERELRTSSRMFEFTFRMFARGFATLPARGMREIPRQLAARLPTETIRLNTRVRSADRAGVTLADEEQIAARAVVIATDADTADQLLSPGTRQESHWRSVTGIYFSAPKSPLNEAIIALNGEAHGQVNNVCVISDVAPGYAPEGRALISVTVLGLPDLANLEVQVRAELRAWFGDDVEQWKHLKTDAIRRALPEQPPTSSGTSPAEFRQREGIYICGDHCASASIEGALVSGTKVAEAILSSGEGRH